MVTFIYSPAYVLDSYSEERGTDVAIIPISYEVLDYFSKKMETSKKVFLEEKGLIKQDYRLGTLRVYYLAYEYELPEGIVFAKGEFGELLQGVLRVSDEQFDALVRPYNLVDENISFHNVCFYDKLSDTVWIESDADSSNNLYWVDGITYSFVEDAYSFVSNNKG